MKLKFVLLTLMLGFAIISCKQSAETNDKAQAPAKEEFKIPDGPLAQKLYANYHQTPATQPQKDENRLIEYAVANNIDVERSASGLYYTIAKTTEEPNFNMGQDVAADYRGITLDGKEFDSSYKRGQPIRFKVGAMIPGWNEALTMMNKGSKATLLIPSSLAYGSRGFPGAIGPNEPLVFELEIPASF